MELNDELYQQLIHIRHADEVKEDLRSKMAESYMVKDWKKVFFIPQGVAMPDAQEGIWNLCRELQHFIEEQKRLDPINGGKPWKIFFASGTGTMAYFAQKYFLQHKVGGVEIVAIPCVGDESTMRDEVSSLAHVDMTSHTSPSICIPSILNSKDVQGVKLPSRRFGDIYPVHLSIWNELNKQTNIEFDLIYAARAFEIMLWHALLQRKNYQLTLSEKRKAHELLLTDNLMQDWEGDYNLLYYHCGGVEGNESQLARHLYKKK